MSYSQREGYDKLLAMIGEPKYQSQCVQVLIRLGGFNYNHIDTIRKAICKKFSSSVAAYCDLFKNNLIGIYNETERNDIWKRYVLPLGTLQYNNSYEYENAKITIKNTGYSDFTNQYMQDWTDSNNCVFGFLKENPLFKEETKKSYLDLYRVMENKKIDFKRIKLQYDKACNFLPIQSTAVDLLGGDFTFKESTKEAICSSSFPQIEIKMSPAQPGMISDGLKPVQNPSNNISMSSDASDDKCKFCVNGVVELFSSKTTCDKCNGTGKTPKPIPDMTIDIASPDTQIQGWDCF